MVVENVFFTYDRNVFSFLSYTMLSDRDAYRPAFDRIAQSFKPLQAFAIRGLQPARFKIQATGGEITFQKYLTGEKAYGLGTNDLAIMSQVDLRQRVPKGRMLKLVAN